MRGAGGVTAFVVAIGMTTAGYASSLSPAFEAATERTPEIHGLVARRAEIDARARSSEALLPGGPWVTVMHSSDAPISNEGARDLQAEFAVPIWLRGERGATLAAALSEGERLEAEIRARRLEVAKRVRDAYWMVADARERLTIAERRRTAAIIFAKSRSEQQQAGQMDLIESKLADADARDAEVSLAGVRAELKQTMIAFRVLTGRDPPGAFSESDAGRATPADHPRVVLRKVAIQKAIADERLIWTVDRERPEAGAFVDHNRDMNPDPFTTSLGVRLKIPFAYDAVNEPKRAAAAAEVIAAQEELGLAEREVGGEAAQANARLDGARQQLKALDARRADLTAVVELTQEAERTGQVMFNELIRVRLQLYEADLARASARVAVERARSDYNQALGLEP